LYCWLSEKKQDCRNAEMKKKEILIIIHWLSQKRENKEQISFFLFFKDNSHSLFFLHFIFMCVLIATSSTCTHFYFRSCILFFGLKVKWNRTDADVWKERKKQPGLRAAVVGLILFKITSKCVRMLNYIDYNFFLFFFFLHCLFLFDFNVE